MIVTLTQLSDRRVQIVAGKTTYYVRCVEPYKHPGEGWDEYTGSGPPGSEPKDGVFDVDDGATVVRVSAKDFGAAWAFASSVMSRPTGRVYRATRVTPVGGTP